VHSGLPQDGDITAAERVIRAHFPPSRIGEVGGLLCKFENENPTASFKVRGALAALNNAQLIGATRVIAASAGNHGSGIAYASSKLGLAATVVVPRDCPAIKLKKMRSYGIDVHVSESMGYDDAEVEAIAMAESEGVPFVSPFANKHVMAGNGGTIAREILAQVPDVASIVVSVGGGGLLAGIIAQLLLVRRDVKLAAVQSEACPAYVRSLEDGKAYTRWEGEESWAEGLEGGTGELAVEVGRAYGVTALAVPEPSVRERVLWAYREHGIAMEGSSAVVFAARELGMLDTLPEPCVHVITGGNIGEDRLRG
jgi:threonine dehydratase